MIKRAIVTLFGIAVFAIPLGRPQSAIACPFWNPLCYIDDALGWIEDLPSTIRDAISDVASLAEDVLTLDAEGAYRDFLELNEGLLCGSPAISLLSGIGGDIANELSRSTCSSVSIPIAPAVQNQLKAYFKSSFQDVLIHPNCNLDDRSAITFGNHIYFKTDRYKPQNADGSIDPWGFALLAHELVHVLQYRKEHFRRFICKYSSECGFGAKVRGGDAGVTCGLEQRAYIQQALILEDMKRDGDGIFACAINRHPEEPSTWRLENVDSHSCDRDIAECSNPQNRKSKYCRSIDNCPNAFNPGQRDSDSDGIGDACFPGYTDSACATDPQTKAINCFVARPVVTQELAEYDGIIHFEIFEAFNNKKKDNVYGVRLPRIALEAGDVVTVDGGGCLQTGGEGPSWRRYVDPVGNDVSAGVIGLRDAILPDGRPAPFPAAIRDVRLQGLRVTAPQNLVIGYAGSRSDDYSNNGYWKRDGGDQNQCPANTPDAFVTIRIDRARSPGTVGGLFIGSYAVVSTLPAIVFPNQVFVTLSASLINTGPALGEVSAVLTTLDPFSFRVMPGQGTLNFPAVPGNGIVKSRNTVTILKDSNSSLDFAKFEWTFTRTASSAPLIVVEPSQTVRVGTTVTVTGGASTNPSGIGTQAYNWTFVSRPSGSGARLLYADTPSVQFVADVAGSFILRLTVSNGASSSTALVTVTAS